jgi:two-component system response regulator PilR (NtrC family)
MATNAALNNIKILVVDDEPDLRTLYELTLLREGFQVETAGSLQESWQLLTEKRFDVVITDMRLPDGMGMELLQRVKAEHRSERCVVITAYGSAENAVESLKAGAFDYLTKPVDLKQFRAVIASAALDATTPPKERRAYAAPGTSNRESGHKSGGNRNDPLQGDVTLKRLVGDSLVMRNVRDRIAKVARSMAPVLVRGESGTGKELAARALHANSHRAAGLLIAVNCSAIPENLLETEFFGVKKGAYTGAAQDREGFFQAASGGTLFLDEIGDLPLAMQSKLLRAIQERSVRPVGGVQEEPVDVRIVSATHRDLAAEVQAGRFRQDLYYRLNVIEIFIPPLRDRHGDLPALCEALLKRIASESGIAVPIMSAHMIEQLALEPLRGNVRELENLLHRAVALSDGDELQIDLSHEQTMPMALGDFLRVEVPATIQTNLPTTTAKTQEQIQEAIPADLQDHLDSQEREILVKVLQETRFNRTAAATRLGLSLRQIRYRIARLSIDLPQSSEANDETA